MPEPANDVQSQSDSVSHTYSQPSADIKKECLVHGNSLEAIPRRKTVTRLRSFDYDLYCMGCLKMFDENTEIVSLPHCPHSLCRHCLFDAPLDLRCKRCGQTIFTINQEVIEGEEYGFRKSHIV